MDTDKETQTLNLDRKQLQCTSIVKRKEKKNSDM